MSLAEAKRYTLETKPICLYPSHDLDSGDTYEEQFIVGSARARGFFRDEILNNENNNENINAVKAKYLLSRIIINITNNLDSAEKSKNLSPKPILEGMISEYKKLFKILTR